MKCSLPDRGSEAVSDQRKSVRLLMHAYGDLRMRIAVATIVCMLFSDCAQSSGVLKMGPDTYAVSAAAAPARGGSSEARNIALTEANEHCARMGKEILIGAYFPGRTMATS